MRLLNISLIMMLFWLWFCGGGCCTTFWTNFLVSWCLRGVPFLTTKAQRDTEVLPHKMKIQPNSRVVQQPQTLTPWGGCIVFAGPTLMIVVFLSKK